MDCYWIVFYIKDGKLEVEYIPKKENWRETMDNAETFAKEVKGYAVFAKKTTDFTRY